MNEYDYIITGSGASGLMLAYRMCYDTYFDNKSVLIIDQEKKTSNDKTWCFWEQGQGEWDQVVHKSWNKILFKSDTYSNDPIIDPYLYKMIRSSKFYEHIWKLIDTKDNFTFVKDTVINISHRSSNASVLTKKSEYHGSKVFNSIMFDKTYRQQNKYPVLRQHFVGWFVETKEEVFDDTAATFMDFTVDQKNNTRFMYVLPTSPTNALFEYTLFSKDLLNKDEYEEEIKSYLNEQGITAYTILEKEQGVIPMTCYKFWKHNSRNVMNIGTVGGWSKPSTGFTFMNIQKRTKEVISFIKSDESFQNFPMHKRFWWYDLLLLDILARSNYLGAIFFSKLFKNNPVQQILKFLDQETNFIEEGRIMLSVPPTRFIMALIKRLFLV